jgi:hypothetical protein
MKPRNEIILLAVLVVVAAGIWHFELSKPTSMTTTSPFEENRKLLAVESSDLDLQQLEVARKTEYLKTVRNIFSHEVPRPVTPPRKIDPVPIPVQNQDPLPPPDPKLPPNLKFFGYGTVPNGTIHLAFFSDGENIVIVSEGETLLGRYRILKVGDANIQFEEITTGRRGTAALEEQNQGPSA